MGDYYDLNNIQQLHSYPHVLQNLQEVPEDPNQIPVQFYDPGTAVEAPQDLSAANVSRWFEQGGGDASSIEQKPPPKARRRPPAGSDHVKHRRTRSGCYTCRQRRVKCDETHPVCERCKKGSRDCTWPEPASATKSASGSKLGQPKKAEDDSASSSEDYEDDEVTPSTERKQDLDAVKVIKARSSLSNLKAATRKQSRTTLNQKRAGTQSEERTKEKSMSPSTEETKSHGESATFSPASKASATSNSTSHDDLLWSRLKSQHQFYLSYHQRSINHCHYFFKHDHERFLSSGLLNFALSYEPLLYAVLGFSAFHYALHQQNGKISEFLSLYNKSMSLLRRDLQNGRKHTDATILTILQLATFEEYLGDWVNLMGHQKAACEMIKELYTPESITQTDMHRKMFSWYTRFELFSGFMAGNALVLSRDWFDAQEKHSKELADGSPDDIPLRVEYLYAQHRMLAVDMNQLMAKVPKGEISIPDFQAENEILGDRIAVWAADVLSLRSHTQYLVMDFEGSSPVDPDDIVNPYEPGTIFTEPLFAVNYMMMDRLSIQVLHKYQTAAVLQQPPSSELIEMSIPQCQIFEAIELWAGSPTGAFLPAQAGLGFICLFMPKEDRYINWCRKKLAKFEDHGYIYPPSLRTKLAELWSIPSLNHYWFTDEDQTPIIRSIRQFIEERTVKPRTQVNEDIRAMKALLAKLNIDESPKESPESTGSVPDSITDSSIGGYTNQDIDMSHDSSWPTQQAGFDENQMTTAENMQMMDDESVGWGLAPNQQQQHHQSQNQWQGFR